MVSRRSSSLSSLDSLLSDLSFASYDSTSGSVSTLSITTRISSPLLLVEEEQIFEEEIEAIEDDNLFLQFLISLMEPDSDGAVGLFYSSSNVTDYSESLISPANGSSNSADMSPSPEAANILAKDVADGPMLPLYLGTPALSLYSEQEATPQQERSTSLLHYTAPSTRVSLVYSVSTNRPAPWSGHLTELEENALYSLKTNISDMSSPTYTPEAHSPTEMTLRDHPVIANQQTPPYDPSLDSLSSSGKQLSTARDIYNSFNNLFHHDTVSSDRLFTTDAYNYAVVQPEEMVLGATSPSYGLLQHFVEMESTQMFGFQLSDSYVIDENKL
ncbi:hypothetical protein V1508DRAFT_406516 [Lipomyces doorenjongii]|uniref:uncharacterized protein n=1 Tax=Lipomyces doorenjongii TaxID=383834 RepID=UPI0034CE310B